MHHYCRRLKQLFESQLGQDLPGWGFIIALILGLIALVILIYLSLKSGKATVQQLVGIR